MTRPPRSCDWTAAEIRELVRRYPDEKAAAIARDLGRPLPAVYNKAHKLKLKKSAHFNASPASGRKFDGNPRWAKWTPEEDAILRARYPHEIAKTIARDIGRPLSGIHRRAKTLGIEKSESFWNDPSLGHRIRPGDPHEIGISGRFPKGHVPANKGKRRPGYAPGRMAETQFKKGRKAENEIPIGGCRLETKGRVWLRKMRLDGPPQFRWLPLARFVWEQHHGPVPKGHVVRINGWDRETPEPPEAVTIDRLECITLAENFLRNSLYRYPDPIVKAIKAKAVLSRAINKKEGRTKHGKRKRRKHDLGSPDSSLRDDSRSSESGVEDGRRDGEGDQRRRGLDHRKREGRSPRA